MQIDILGTRYDFIITPKSQYIPPDDLGVVDSGAFCDPFNKKIAIIEEDNKLDQQRLMRHEITHAFFFESGFLKHYDDEDITDWFAVQFPKLIKVFEEIGAI